MLKTKRRKSYLITFDSPAAASAFAKTDSFDNITLEGASAKVDVLGSVTKLMEALNGYTVIDFDTQKNSLEEVFMQYYGSTEAKENATKQGGVR